nr:MAG TPA: hypothetical protein [Caudoviricetes sp.]
MIEVASCVGTVKYIRRGISAISYEIALDTNSVTADGETGKFLTTNLGRFRFIKHIGGNSKEQNDVYGTFDYLMVFIGYDGKCLKYSDGGYYYSTNEGTDNIYSSMEVNDVAEKKVKLIKIFWYDGPVYADDNHNYIDSLCENLGVPAENIPLEILASNTFTVVRDGKKGDPGIGGARGSSGPVWRQHVGFVSATADAPYQYYAGSNDERFIDVVLIDKVWYRCLQSYQSTGTDDVRNTPTNAEFAKYWTSADMSNFTFIATQFLLADNAKINLFGSNEINLYNDNENGTLFASFRVPSGKLTDFEGDRGEYVLWIGATDPLDSSFSVKKDGIAHITCCYFGKQAPILDAEEGIYYGVEYNDGSENKDDYHPYVRSVWLDDSGCTFGFCADNVLYGQTGWGGYVKMWQMNGFDTINNDHSQKYPKLTEAAIEIRKSLADLPDKLSAYDCIGISLTSIGNKRADSIGLDISSFNGQNSIGLRISATGGTKNNHAIQVTSGDIAGLRPYIRETSISATLSIYDHTVYCTNSGAITLTLPRSPIKGQEYLIIQGNGKVNIEASHVFFGEGASGSTKTWWSGTKNQFSWLIFTGSVWVVQYVIR